MKVNPCVHVVIGLLVNAGVTVVIVQMDSACVPVVIDSYVSAIVLDDLQQTSVQ